MTMVLLTSTSIVIQSTLVGVDIELWAHEHEYQRMWPVYNRTVYNGSDSEPYVDPKAPVHVITGSAVSHTVTLQFQYDNTILYRVVKRDMSSLLMILCPGMLLVT